MTTTKSKPRNQEPTHNLYDHSRRHQATSSPRTTPRATPARLAAARQDDFIARGRADSTLDRSIPLGYPPHQFKTECGPTAARYFADRHRRGIFGRHYPLHRTLPPRDE